MININKIYNWYDICPVFVQNILVSLYGLHVERVRHKGKYDEYLQKYTNNLYKSKEYIVYNQLINMQNVIKTAYNEVPYYKKLFDFEGIKADRINDYSDLLTIPYLEKQTIRDYEKELISTKYDVKRLFKICTTGTTGTPLNIYCNNNVRQINYAFYDRWLQTLHIDPREAKATIGGRLVVPIEQKKEPYWRRSWFQNNTYFSSYHFLYENMKSIINELERFKPCYIDAYPSSVYTLAQYIVNNNINIKNKLKAIITSAETLFDDMRETIEQAFKSPVFDQYGSAEMCVFIAQCSCGSYHVHSDYSVVEFINEQGEPAQGGEEAEIVCTSLINPVMPLIRYKIGDMVTLSSDTCSCGLPFPVVANVMGRSDDYIQTPEGRRVGRLSPVLKSLPIKEAQYIQDDIDSLTVVIVPDNGYTDDTEHKVVKELRKRLGYSIDLQFDYTERISRGKGGKYRSIISNV